MRRGQTPARVLVILELVACGGGVVTGDDAADDAESKDASLDVATVDQTVIDAPADVMVADVTVADVAPDVMDAGVADVVDADVEASSFDASACSYYDAKTCSNLPWSNVVNVTCSAVPPAAGGTIEDGYYLLTSATYNTAIPDAGCFANQTHRDTIQVCGGTMLWLDIDTVNSSYQAALTYTTNGATLTTNGICGGSGGAYPYTATPTTLTIYGDYPNSTIELVLTLTKQ